MIKKNIGNDQKKIITS